MRDDRMQGGEGVAAATAQAEIHPFYYDLRNKLLKPWDTYPLSKYFIRKWMPILGPTYTQIVITFRDLAAETVAKGEGEGISVSFDELARRTQIPPRTLERHLSPRVFEARETAFLTKFLRPKTRYVYEPSLGRKVRAPNAWEVALDDPLLPDDEETLRTLCTDQEIQDLLRKGVVDLSRYAELKRARELPSAPESTDRQSGGQASSNRQNGGQMGTNRQSGGQKNVSDAEDFQLTANLAALSSSSSSRKDPETATAAADPDQHERLARALVKHFDGHLAIRKARTLIDEHGLENVRNQLAWFDDRDNTWAVRGPVAAFVTYCENRTSAPPETLERQERERQAQLKEGHERYRTERLAALRVGEGLDEGATLEAQIDATLAEMPYLRGDRARAKNAVLLDAEGRWCAEGKLLDFKQWVARQGEKTSSQE